MVLVGSQTSKRDVPTAVFFLALRVGSEDHVSRVRDALISDLNEVNEAANTVCGSCKFNETNSGHLLGLRMLRWQIPEQKIEKFNFAAGLNARHLFISHV